MKNKMGVCEKPMENIQINRIRFTLLSLFMGLFVLLLFPLGAEAAVPVTARIPVSCSGGNPLESLTFVMEMETKEMQTPDQLMIRLKAEEEGAFTIHYAYPGTYHYRIRQETGKDSKTTYDSTVYEVDMFVTEDEKGVLYAEPVLYTKGSSEKKAEIRFKNTAAGEPSKNSRSSSVQTGDTAQKTLYLSLFAGSAALLVLLGSRLLRKRRR